MWTLWLSVVLLGALFVGPAVAVADEGDAFENTLKQQDPAAHQTFIGLRAERDRSLEELKRVLGEYKAASSQEARTALSTKFNVARKKYADSYVAFIDFLDERDRKAIASYEAAIARIKGIIDKRQQARTDVLQALKDE